MPVKWTPDNDQLLLIKILETHDLQVDGNKVVDAWPKDKGEVPTPRAIKERLVKIRQNSKEAGVSKGSSTPRTSPIKTATGSGRKGKPASTNSTVSPTKRKRQETVDDEPYVKGEPDTDDDDVVEVSAHTATPKMTPNGSFAKTEMPGTSSSYRSTGSNFTMPTTPTPARGMRKVPNQTELERTQYGRIGGYDGADYLYNGDFDDEVAV